MTKLEKVKNVAVQNNIALIYIFGSQVHTGLDILHGISHKVNDPLTDIDVGVVVYL